MTVYTTLYQYASRFGRAPFLPFAEKVNTKITHFLTPLREVRSLHTFLLNRSLFGRPRSAATGWLFKRNIVAASIATVLFAPAVYAADIFVEKDGDSFEITGDGDGDPNAFKGVPFSAGIEDGIAVFRIRGDVSLDADDTLTGIADVPIALYARNDINIANGASVTVSANFGVPGPGGGNGGSGGALGTAWPGSDGGRGGGGGAGGGGPAGSGNDGADGSPSRSGTDGTSGGPGSSGTGGFGNASGGGAAGNGGAGGSKGAAQIGVGPGGSASSCSSRAAGGNGGAGGAGGPGTNALSANGGSNGVTGEALSGGGGGGGGGGSGGGGSGAGGSGGGGGDGGCGSGFTAGHTGGGGGTGGKGGEGGRGTQGGSGGAGGGAIEFRSFGRSTLAGLFLAQGGFAGSGGLRNLGELGAEGNAGGGGNTSGTTRRHSGAGGKGGNGGNGGDGGASGAGGGGSGGTIKLAASVLDARQVEVNASGRSGGGDGRLLLASNVADPAVESSEGVAPIELFEGPRTLNTFIDGVVETPYIAGLVGGAEAFGLTGLTSGDFPDVVSGASGASAALVRRAIGPGAFADDYVGHDFLFFVNLTTGALNNPRLGVGRDGFLDSLKSGGVEADPDFGGPGVRALSVLGASEVYAVLIPTDTQNFNFAADTASGSEIAKTTVLGVGEVLYLGSTGTTPPPAGALAASVLPGSRSVQTGGTATVFATMINSSASAGSRCSIAPVTTLNADFSYQMTDPATNRPIGSPNQPAEIPAGDLQTFLLSFTPNTPMPSTDVRLRFGCENLTPASEISGVNTVQLSASDDAVADVVALAQTISNDGTVRVPGSSGVNAFSVATVNVGATSDIEVTADTGSATLPLNISLCQTDPNTGACQGSAGTNVETTVDAGATPTFSVFVQARGSVPFDPAVNRVFVRFRDSSGTVRGSTSVAVTTE